MLVRYFTAGLLIMSAPHVGSSQSTAEAPRFNGNRAVASSVEAIVPNDAQRLIDQENERLLNALTGAAVFEAAREEGRYFVEERRQREIELGGE